LEVFPHIGGCALSLLSSRSDSWLSPSDLSTRCSAALRELIAENRAAIMARQFVSDRDWHIQHHAVEDMKEIQPESNYFPQHMFPQTQWTTTTFESVDIYAVSVSAFQFFNLLQIKVRTT